LQYIYYGGSFVALALKPSDFATLGLMLEKDIIALAILTDF
jgi:hypothetical protein